MGYRLTSDERGHLGREGYVVRSTVFTERECAEITTACEELVERLVRDRTGRRQSMGSYVFDRDETNGVFIKWEGDSDVVHGIEPFAHLSPELRRWALDARFVDPMVDLVGDPAPELFTEKLNLKRPHHGGVNPLHQDYPYWERIADDPARVATAMLFLDDASLANGTRQVLPGSHTGGKWATRNDRDAFGNLEIDPAEETGHTAVPVEVDAGSVVFFGSLLVHKSAPNDSDRERRTLLFSYQPAGHTHLRDAVRRRAGTAESAKA